MDSPVAVKIQHEFVEDNETKMLSLPWMADTSMKAGEIFRNDQGEYSFMCFHCGFTFQEFGATINHIDTHFETNEIKFDIEAQTPEFVVCSVESEVSNVSAYPEVSVRRGRKRKLSVDINAHCSHTESETDVTHSHLLSLNKSRNSESTISNMQADIQVPEHRDIKIKEMLDIPKDSPCAESETEEVYSLFLNKSTTLESQISHLQVPEHGIRKRTPMLDIPQHCPICELWSDDFRTHLKTKHNITDRIYQCFICRAFHKSFSALKNHISCRNHTKSKCYHCEMEPPVTKPSDPRRHKCLFCKSWFPNHIDFKIHFKEAHNKDADYFFHKRSNCNIFTCYICEREFPLRYYLVAHMKSHHEKFLRHQCPTCGKRVRTFGQLTQHLKKHEGKTFTCDQCDKSFPYYAKLRIHLGSHRTELNYKCNTCSKAFKLRKYLNRHMAVHDNVKKYACRFCEASFNFTSGRRGHEKTQHKAL